MSLTFVLIWYDRIYGYTPRDHELLPTSTQLLRQQAAAAAESSNSADSGKSYRLQRETSFMKMCWLCGNRCKRTF